MASIFDEIGKIGLDGKQITFLDALQGRGLPQYSSNPFNVPTPTGINYNDLTQQLSNQPINRAGLISNANAETNTQISTQQPSSSNIFGDVLGTVFPGIDQSNKQLINAAILQGSLELLKPRQAGENLASQFGRAITAGQKVGTDLEKQALEKLVTQFGLQKTAAQIQKLQKDTKEGKPIQQSKEQSRIYKSAIDSLIDIDKDFASDINTIQKKAGDYGGLEEETKDLLSLAAIDLVNRGEFKDPTAALREVAKRLATGQLSINNQNQESTQPGVDQDADITED